jgi:putative DNA primase/helicase
MLARRWPPRRGTPARRLYREPVTWRPSHQLVYVTNRLPVVKGNDPAVWRRMRVVPFDVVFPPEQWDRELPERLTLHADAILSWAIAGHFDYEDNGGMREPASVVRATGNYKADSDDVARFIKEACDIGPYKHAYMRDLFAAWQRWASDGGAEPMTERAFGKELDRLGYPAGSHTKYGTPRQNLCPKPLDDGLR